MASVPVHCQPVKIHVVQALELCSTPYCLHAEGTQSLSTEIQNLTIYSQLADEFQTFYKTAFRHIATAEVLKHCQHDLIQLIWCLILDDESIHSVYGLMLEFIDKICCQFFPHVLTHSANYPEKVLMACLKYLTCCPCPRCLICKSNIRLLGTQQDQCQHITLARNDSELHQFRVEN